MYHWGRSIPLTVGANGLRRPVLNGAEQDAWVFVIVTTTGSVVSGVTAGTNKYDSLSIQDDVGALIPCHLLPLYCMYFYRHKIT
jgi:hypothetical protein